jgi:hypothetical protein
MLSWILLWKKVTFRFHCEIQYSYHIFKQNFWSFCRHVKGTVVPTDWCVLRALTWIFGSQILICMSINKIKIWMDISHLSALKTHCSAGTNVHLNRNKFNYKSSLGTGIDIASDDRRHIAPDIARHSSFSQMTCWNPINLDSSYSCRQVSGTKNKVIWVDGAHKPWKTVHQGKLWFQTPGTH